MPFEPRTKRSYRGAEGVDPNIYQGKKTMPQDLPKLTNRELREKETMTLLRRLKPTLRKAYKTASELVDDPNVSPSVRLQASKFLIDIYMAHMKELYSKDYDKENAEPVTEDAPKFSLVMLPTKEAEPKQEE